MPGPLRQRLANAIVDLLYPPRCARCGQRGGWVCAECRLEVTPFAPPWCRRCGAPPGQTSCRCETLPAAISRVRSAGAYEGWLRDAILHFKYHGESARAGYLGELLAGAITDLGPIDALVPVPLHRRRVRERGYNQATLLAKRVGTLRAIPVEEMLERTRATDQQARLSAVDRWPNVRGAFALRPGATVADRRLLLIDDVLTTGATLGACAEVLLAGGAAVVMAATLAREA